MTFHIVIAAFVVACALTAIFLAFVVMRQGSIVLEETHTAEKPLPEWLRHELARRMDVPGKYPARRTRHSRSMR